MVSLRNRKRRLSEAFPEKAEDDPTMQLEKSSSPSRSAEPESHMDVENVEDEAVEVEAVETERHEKEQAIWDTFREEYFEALEQLPLSLHRSFALIKELDTQTSEHSQELISTLRAYLQLRGFETPPGQGDATGSTTTSNAQQPSPPTEVPAPPPDALPDEMPRFIRRSSTRSPTKNTSKASASPKPNPLQRVVSSATPTDPITPRQRSAILLTKIARLSEELVRAGSEKINVARYANDIVNRHIKDLDRAIKEQETSISLGLRPGTHPASIILPELVIPKYRATGATHDDSSDSDEAMPDALEETSAEPVPEPPEDGKPMKTPRKKGRVKHARKKSDVELEVRDAPETEKVDVSLENRATRNSRSLKLTLPPMSAIAALKEAAIDPNEPRYCYCNQVSYGEMIGCDGPDCQREWFHVGCLGLEQLPTTTSWYCPDCRKAPKRKKGR